MELEQKVEEQTVVEVNGKKIDLSRIGNERVAQALGKIHDDAYGYTRCNGDHWDDRHGDRWDDKYD